MTDDQTLRAVAEAAARGPWELRGLTAVYGNLQRDTLRTGDLVSRAVVPTDATYAATFDPPTVLSLLDEIADLTSQVSHWQAEYDLARTTARADGLREAAEIIRQQRAVFASDEYATPQPIGSIQERFACDRCLDAINDAIRERAASVGAGEMGS